MIHIYSNINIIYIHIAIYIILHFYYNKIKIGS